MIEIRSIVDNLTLKEENDKCVIEGKAINYDVAEVMYKDRFGNEYRECISANALSDVDFSDVPLRYNHDSEKAKILARARQHTLTIENRQDGLYFTAELTTNLGKDVYTAIQNGDINGCSFGFICEEDDYDEKTKTRTVNKISKLTDISVVDNPAYKATFVEARSDEETNYFAEKEKEIVKAKEEEQRKKLILLSMI